MVRVGGIGAATARHPNGGSETAARPTQQLLTRWAAMSTETSSKRWSIVFPVKGSTEAKSRLGHNSRADLARSFALDAVEAALTCEAVAQVLVVTADQVTANAHADLGALVVCDPGEGLNAALRVGASAAAPDAPCALLLADLPCLRPADLLHTLLLCEALFAEGAQQVTVPDAEGTGTVLLAAGHPAALQPHFGAGSAASHAAQARVLIDVAPSVRRDVDIDAQLHEALRLGVGPRTRAVLASSPWLAPTTATG